MKEELADDSVSRPDAYRWAAMIALPLRLVVGWTYFSAFWRRLVLENKLIPDDPGYIGVKFNHFLPNALGIKPMIEYLVTHPSELWWFMAAFTVIEFFVGLMLMLGLLTRLASAGVFFLALGILLGSGWLGTTCVDEWQIGILGMCAGLLLFLTGGGTCSLDGKLARLPLAARHSSLFAWMGSGPLPLGYRSIAGVSVLSAVFMMAVALGTNQFFHGGVWGPLHNKSVKPLLEISGASLADQDLRFTVFRTEGVDTYGSFLVRIRLTDGQGNTLWRMEADRLSNLSPAAIENAYLARVKPGAFGLVVPLGAKAALTLPVVLTAVPAEPVSVILTDVSGKEWSAPVRVSSLRPAGPSPNEEALKSFRKDSEGLLAEIAGLARKRYESGLGSWKETVQAKLELLEFRRNNAPTLQQRVQAQKDIVALLHEVFLMEKKAREGSVGALMEEWRAHEQWLAAQIRLLEMEKRASAAQ